MSASFQSSVSAANSPAGLEQALSRAVQDLAAHRGWRLMNRTSSAVAFQVGVNWFSWGHTVTVPLPLAGHRLGKESQERVTSGVEPYPQSGSLKFGGRRA
jgi:hypothetical protein